MEVVMRIRKVLLTSAFGSIFLLGTAAYAAPQERFEPWERGAERQEQIARSEIRRGEAMEQEGHRLERMGEWRRGEMLERRGEYMERHGRMMLRQAEQREHYGERWEDRRWR
jgi:hypothetical protein